MLSYHELIGLLRILVQLNKVEIFFVELYPVSAPLSFYLLVHAQLSVPPDPV